MTFVRSGVRAANALRALTIQRSFTKHAEGAPPKKVIVVPGRLVNVVI